MYHRSRSGRLADYGANWTTQTLLAKFELLTNGQCTTIHIPPLPIACFSKNIFIQTCLNVFIITIYCTPAYTAINVAFHYIITLLSPNARVFYFTYAIFNSSIYASKKGKNSLSFPLPFWRFLITVNWSFLCVCLLFICRLGSWLGRHSVHCTLLPTVGRCAWVRKANLPSCSKINIHSYYFLFVSFSNISC